LEEHKTDIMNKNLNIINFVVSLIIKAVVIPFLSDQSHQPISRTKKSPFPRALKMSEFFKKPPLPEAIKTPQFSGDSLTPK